MENYLGRNSSIKLSDNSSEITFNSKIDDIHIGRYVVMPVKTQTTTDNYYFKITEIFKQDFLFTKVKANEVGNTIINNVGGVEKLWGQEVFLVTDPHSLLNLKHIQEDTFNSTCPACGCKESTAIRKCDKCGIPYYGE